MENLRSEIAGRARALRALLQRDPARSSVDRDDGLASTPFDNRPTWDNLPGRPFDNQPTWDNWNKI
jgi:hypothetical protein